MKRLFFVLTICMSMPWATLAAGDTIGEAFGANVHLRQRIPAAEWEQALDQAEAAGVQWAREEFEWDVVEPADGSYSFTAYDNVVAAYQDHDIEVLGLLTYSSDWASSNPGSQYAEFYMPDESAWRDYVGTVAEHYAGDIDTWEIWNEPNHPGFWRSDFADYVTLLEIAADEIHKRNPDARVVLGGLSGSDTDFLERLYAALSDPSIIDIVAVHPYRHVGNNFNHAPEKTVDGLGTLLNDLYNVKAVLNRYNQDTTPIWLTEVGWTTYDDGVSQQTQARFVTRLYTIALSVPQVKKVFWYAFSDTTDDTQFHDAHFGLVTHSYARKQSFAAYQFVAQQLAGYRVKEVLLPQQQLVSDFSQDFPWSMTDRICTIGAVNGNTKKNRLRVDYQFTQPTNCYALVARSLPLPRKTRALAFRARGSDDNTILRVRVTDRTGETFQYNLGLMPDEWLPYIVQLSQHAVHWGGDNDGKLDQPVSFHAFVVDNGAGSMASGRALFDDLVASRHSNAYLFRLRNATHTTYALWKSKGSARMTLLLKKAEEIRVIYATGTKRRASKSKRYRIKATPFLKFVKRL